MNYRLLALTILVVIFSVGAVIYDYFFVPIKFKNKNNKNI